MSLTKLPDAGAFTNGDRNILNAALAQLYGGLALTGKCFYLDPANGSDSYDGSTPEAEGFGPRSGPMRSLAAAYAALRAGKNDYIVLIGDGSTAATARVDSAFTWAKRATYMVGISSGTMISPRARIAPSSGTTAFANFFTVSADGCGFGGIQWFQDFGTDTTNQICMTLTASRIKFVRCHIADAGDGTDAGRRDLKITSGAGNKGENEFIDCTIGVDTFDISAASASVEFAGQVPRNIFRNCIFPKRATDTDPLFYVIGASGADRFQLFQNCSFLNVGTSTMAVAGTIAANGANGFVVFQDSTLVGGTEWGDATALAQIRVMGASGTAATTGIAIQPS